MKQILISGVIALFLSLMGTPLLIKLLARKGYGQFIRDDGPRGHHSKRGTPTMGGIAFIAATLVAYAATKLIVGSVGMVDLDDPPDLNRLRVYVGYAGWAAGQLDGELEQESWIVEDAHPDDPFRDGDLWSEVLARKGGEFALLARMPADPSVN